MKKYNLCFLLVFILVSLFISAGNLVAQDKQKPTYPPLVCANTELRPIHSNVTDRDYLLYIGYPDSYFSNPERIYPVVYITDAYWNFVRMWTLGPGFWYDEQAPEYILVGIGYAGENVNYNNERMFELSPSNQDYGWPASMNCRMGGARQFLTAIKTEIIPYIEKNTHADKSFRVISGASMGGLFTLFAMYEEPGLWNGVISLSPVAEWDHCWLFRRESELRHKALGDDYKGVFNLNTRLFMSVGGVEDPVFAGGIKAFNEIISSAGYGNFDYEFRVVEDEGHATTCAESFNRGLRFVFKEEMAKRK